MWPTDREVLRHFGQRELSLVIEHFRPLLLNKVSIDAIFSEWDAFKAFWLDNLVSKSKKEVWSIVLSRVDSKYLNLVHLVELLFVFPVRFSSHSPFHSPLFPSSLLPSPSFPFSLAFTYFTTEQNEKKL